MPEEINDQIAKLRQTIADLEARQRELDIDFSGQIIELRERLGDLGAVSQTGSGGAAAGGGVAAGEGGAAVGGDVTGPVIVAGDGARIIIGEHPVAMTAVERESALGRYLAHVVSRNRFLQLQGIRSGGRLVNIELENIYVTLKATRRRSAGSQEAWLAEERRAPGERQRVEQEHGSEAVSVKVEEALSEHSRLVILGDPGSGKTTLLRYLALCYARDRAEDSTLVRQRLGLEESGYLPVLLPLRNLGAYLKNNHPRDDGTEGHGRLLKFLQEYLKGERIDVPGNFFDADLEQGRVAILFDGMDEVGDFDLRRRVARLIEALASAHPACRLVVTSRIVGYTGAARLGDNFATTTVRDFSLADVRQFLTHWHRLVAIGQMGPGASAEQSAAQQTNGLMEAIRDNPRVHELAINPLMLTVIALVHRDRVKLPERRAELYAEAVDVLLGKWDEARGLEDSHILDDRAFDTGDRRLVLQSIALRMHNDGQKEIAADDLLGHLRKEFGTITDDDRSAERATDRFLTVIKERTGLLVEAGQGIYRFSHLTFQEYLAAVAVAERDDYLDYTLNFSKDAFWREVVLLEAGYLSMKSKEKTTRLIKAIADLSVESEPFHNLVLAAECIRDVGPTRVEGNLTDVLNTRLQKELEAPIPRVFTGWAAGIWGKVTGVEERRRLVLGRRIAAATAVNRIQSGTFGTKNPYWSMPFGEPEWITVPEGEFWLGSDDDDLLSYSAEKPIHRFWLTEFHIARTPITNQQYRLYVGATGAAPPRDWEDGEPPRDKVDHPVIYVSWYDALGYCEWLSQVIGKTVSLPSEAEWEKAARGGEDKRVYPWGNEFDPVKCNSSELGLSGTSPVGIFPAGASPYGCLDMSGNVWEWTRSLWGEDFAAPTFKYPFDPKDKEREDLEAPENVYRMLRGGACFDDRGGVRCAYRSRFLPRLTGNFIGFRVVLRFLP